MSTTMKTDYKVADLSLAKFGRKEIELAEHEMPGLMFIRDEMASDKPLEGVRVSGSLHMTIQTAVLIESLVGLGADVRWQVATSSVRRTMRLRRSHRPEFRFLRGKGRRWRSIGGVRTRS